MPYTPVSITGYNANPPEDDGSATQNNEIAWQKHLDKIGAPLKTAIESTQTNVGVSIDAIDVTLAAGLTDISALAKTDGNIIVGNGTTWVAESGATARTSLGLGTIATQPASSVAITGGSITGITDLAVADGGTGASTAANARTNLGLGSIATVDSPVPIANGGTASTTAAAARTALGLGTMATQDNTAVNIDGGTIDGITDLAVADGGTGSSTAAGARTNLGLGSIATVNSPVPIANGGTASTTAAGARTALGLGTAAVANTGTSGTTLGFLDGVNTYTGTHRYTNNAWNLITFSATGATNGKTGDAAGNINSSRTGSGQDNHLTFFNSNGGVGSIQTQASGTLFNTSSDARLKTKLKPAKDVGAVIDDIKIYDFTWKADGKPGFGPMAQELHKVLPSAVSVGGDDPKLEPWSWDASKLVPYLIVELQALRKRVAELEAK